MTPFDGKNMLKSTGFLGLMMLAIAGGISVVSANNGGYYPSVERLAPLSSVKERLRVKMLSTLSWIRE
jgi:hypothetical protein